MLDASQEAANVIIMLQRTIQKFTLPVYTLVWVF